MTAHGVPSRGFLGRFELRRIEVTLCSLAGAASAAVLLFMVPAVAAVASGLLVAAMLLIALIDSRHMIIPDALSLPAIPLGLVAAVAARPGPWTEVLSNHAAAALAGGLSLYMVRWFYQRTRGVQGLGLGDVKLAAAAGAWVGLGNLPMTCLLATGAALAAVLARKVTHPGGGMRMTTAIPLGSFIAPAIIVMWGLTLFPL